MERAESVKSSSSGLGDSSHRSYETDQENVPPRPASSAGSQSGYGSLPLFRPAEDPDQSQSSSKWDRSGRLQRHMGSVMRRFRSVLRTPSRESTEQVPEPPRDMSTPAPEPVEDAMDTENVPPQSRAPLAPLPLDGARVERQNAAGDTMYNTVDLSKKPMRTPAKTPHSSRKTKSSFTTHSPVAGRPREMPRASGAAGASPSAALARMQLYDASGQLWRASVGLGADGGRARHCPADVQLGLLRAAAWPRAGRPGRLSLRCAGWPWAQPTLLGVP